MFVYHRPRQSSKYKFSRIPSTASLSSSRQIATTMPSFTSLPREIRDKIYEASIDVTTYDHDAIPQPPPEPDFMKSEFVRRSERRIHSIMGDEGNYREPIPKYPPDTLDFLKTSIYRVIPLAATSSQVREEILAMVVRKDAITFLISPIVHNNAGKDMAVSHLSSFLHQLTPEDKNRILSNPMKIRLGLYNNARYRCTINNTDYMLRQIGKYLHGLQEVKSLRIFAAFDIWDRHAPGWNDATFEQILDPNCTRRHAGEISKAWQRCLNCCSQESWSCMAEHWKVEAKERLVWMTIKCIRN